MNNELDDKKIIQYLLGGSLSDDVEVCDDYTRNIEELFLTDPNFFNHMLAVEDDLIASYALGELTPEERSRFEQKYAQNSRIGERIQFFRALDTWAEKNNRA